MKTKLHKIKTWILRDDLNLNNRWWHRFLKVVFVLCLVLYAVYLGSLLFDSYYRIVNRWEFKNVLAGRLSDSVHTGKVFAINDLLGDHEIISTLDQVYSKGGFSPSYEQRLMLNPYSPMFVLSNPPVQTFCSDRLSDNIKDIAIKNNIRLFSEENPRVDRLTSSVDSFISYLSPFTMKCVMVDSFTIVNDNGSESKYVFLRPVNTYDYGIYKYEDGTLVLILAVVVGILAYIFSIFIALVLYYKVILYIVFGAKK